MSTLSEPKVCRDADFASVIHGGKRFNPGTYRVPEKRSIAELNPPSGSETIQRISDRYIEERASAFLSHGEYANCRRAFEVLNALYGHEPADNFSPRKLKIVIDGYL